MSELTILMKDENKEVAIKVSSELTADGLLDEIMGLLVAYGYHPHSVERAICDKADDLNQQNEDTAV